MQSLTSLALGGTSSFEKNCSSLSQLTFPFCMDPIRWILAVDCWSISPSMSWFYQNVLILNTSFFSLRSQASLMNIRSYIFNMFQRVKFQNIMNYAARSYFHKLEGQLKFTQECLKTIQEKQSGKFKGQFLRLAVEGGEGCQGYKYNFKFDLEVNEDDHLLMNDDKTIFAVDAETLKLVEGSTIDYEDRMVRSAFVVQTNPQAEKSCSCKISFQPKGLTQ